MRGSHTVKSHLAFLVFPPGHNRMQRYTVDVSTLGLCDCSKKLCEESCAEFTRSPIVSCYKFNIISTSYISNNVASMQKIQKPPSAPTTMHFREQFLLYNFLMSTTHLMQSPAFISLNAWLIWDNGCLCVMNSSTLSLPFM